MPTESELRQLLAEAEAPGALDAARIIRKSKARRLPAQVAAGGVFTLAIASVGVFGFSGMLNPATMSDGAGLESAEQSDFAAPGSSAEESAIELGRGSAAGLNLCGTPVASVSPNPSGLRLDLELPRTAQSGADVSGTAILTNNGDEHVTGTTGASPIVTVAEDGIVVWHSHGFMTMQAIIVDLGPGESMEYPAHLTPVRCGPEDETDASFRPDLPPLEAGEYSVSAAIDFIPDAPAAPDSPAAPEVVVGDATTIALE